MKKILFTILCMAFATSAFAGWGGSLGENFVKEIYVSGTATGGTGNSYSSPKPFVDGDLWNIPAKAVIKNIYVIVDVAITGTSNIGLGDDDDADGFLVPGSITLNTPGIYGYNINAVGAYLKVAGDDSSAPSTSKIPNIKYYSATGKEIKLDVSGTNSAGKMRVIIEGYLSK